MSFDEKRSDSGGYQLRNLTEIESLRVKYSDRESSY